MIPINTELLTNDRIRPYLNDAVRFALRRLKGVVVHHAETSESASVRRLAYNNGASEKSVHYLVDDHAAIHCIPDNELAFHTQGRMPAVLNDNDRHSSDYFFIGVEICHPVAGDRRHVYENAAVLIAYILRKHRLSIWQLYRSSSVKPDISEEQWKGLLDEVEEAMRDVPQGLAERARVGQPHAAVFRGPSAAFPVAEHLPEGALVAVFEHEGEFRRIGRHLWISSRHLNPEKTEILHFVREPTGVNVRSGPGMHFPVVDALPHGSIVDALRYEQDWAAIGEQRWLHASALSAVRISYGEVVGTGLLNVRSGPDTSYRIVRRLARGAEVEVWEEHGAWFRIGEDEWVYGSFVGLKN